jgi:hypothetical protein
MLTCQKSFTERSLTKSVIMARCMPVIIPTTNNNTLKACMLDINRSTGIVDDKAGSPRTKRSDMDTSDKSRPLQKCWTERVHLRFYTSLSFTVQAYPYVCLMENQRLEAFRKTDASDVVRPVRNRRQPVCHRRYQEKARSPWLSC